MLAPESPLDTLAAAIELIISDETERFDLFQGLETRSRFTVMDPGARPVLLAETQSSRPARAREWLLPHASRPLRMKLFTPRLEPVVTIDRPARWARHELTVYTPHGRRLGSVSRRVSLLHHRYDVKHANDGEFYELLGPLFRSGIFRIVRRGRDCGVIRRKLHAAFLENSSRREPLRIEFPAGIDIDRKCVLIAAALLVDAVHFQDRIIG
ncbi:MAG: hypothetical protein JSV80_01165 [Acidobacteriota bacterium]|nr:MAG: hypothetical protein JSV80_01165 [Acidobacteriota bacterium]